MELPLGILVNEDFKPLVVARHDALRLQSMPPSNAAENAGGPGTNGSICRSFSASRNP
jgi:hypothetical protein